MRDILNILRYSTQLRPYYIAVTFFSILVAVITLAQPFITKGVVDEFVSGNQQTRTLVLLVVLYFVSDFGLTLLSNIGGYFGDMMTIKLRRYLSERYYERLLQLPQRFFDNERTGALVNRLNRSIENLTQTIQIFANNFLQLLITTIMTFVIAALYSWIAAILMTILYPLLLWLTRRTSARWQDIEKEKNVLLDVALGRFTEVIGQMRVVKSFRQGGRELDLFKNQYGSVIPLTDEQSRLWHNQDVLRRLLLNIIFAGIFATVVWQTNRGDLELGEMVLLIQYTALVRIPLFSLSFIVDNIQRAIAGSRDFFEVMALETEPGAEEETTVQRIPGSEASVTFDQASFAYEELEVISDISFTIEPGKKLALVSESGGGKTTLANLLMGLYRPSSGTITVGGKNVSQMPFYWLREQVGVVFQDAELFSGSLFENIAYAQPEATMAQVEEAAKAANAHDFISSFADGYHSEIGERGIKLSGGQKQRVAIARALLKDAPILILDEATSALDSKAEVEVQDALDRLMAERTTLVIAHRLSTIAEVDTILTLKEGNVDEVGSPAELARSGGIYNELLDLQKADPEQRKTQMKQFDLTG